jgi:hypothetical protein
MRHRGQADRSSRVTIADIFYGISSQYARCVDGFLVKIGPSKFAHWSNILFLTRKIETGDVAQLM